MFTVYGSKKEGVFVDTLPFHGTRKGFSLYINASHKMALFAMKIQRNKIDELVKDLPRHKIIERG